MVEEKGAGPEAPLCRDQFQNVDFSRGARSVLTVGPSPSWIDVSEFQNSYRAKPSTRLCSRIASSTKTVRISCTYGFQMRRKQIRVWRSILERTQ